MQQFLEPVSPWALNASQLDALRQKVVEADTSAAQEADPIMRIRAEQHAKALRRELGAAETTARLETQRQAMAQAQQRLATPQAANAASEPQFLEPVAYYATEEPKGRAVTTAQNARRGALVVNAASGVMGSGVR